MRSVQHLRGLSNTLAAGVLLGGVDNGEACLSLSAIVLVAWVAVLVARRVSYWEEETA